MKVTWREHEVQHPLGRMAIVMMAVIIVPVGLIISLCVVLPISLIVGTLLHPILRLMGRKGVYRSTPGNFVIKLDREAFRRA